MINWTEYASPIFSNNWFDWSCQHWNQLNFVIGSFERKKNLNEEFPLLYNLSINHSRMKCCVKPRTSLWSITSTNNAFNVVLFLRVCYGIIHFCWKMLLSFNGINKLFKAVDLFADTMWYTGFCFKGTCNNCPCWRWERWSGLMSDEEFPNLS